MRDSGIVEFVVQGWLDRNDSMMSGKSHKGWFKLFGRPNPDILVEAEFSSSESPFDERSCCVFLPKDDIGKSIIYISAKLPPERFNQIYQTLCRNESCLERIDVSIAYDKKIAFENEFGIGEIIFTTRAGEYF